MKWFQKLYKHRDTLNMFLKKIIYIFAICFFSHASGEVITKLKVRQPNWRLEKALNFEDGSPKKIIYYALLANKEIPVKEVLYNQSGRLIQESDLSSTYAYHGPSVTYDDQARIERIVFYNEGTIHGEVKDIYSNGMLKKVTNYENGIRQGAATVYFDNGEIAKKSFYANDKLDGACITYYPNGIRESELFYEKGVLQGEAIYWYENGQFKSKRYYTYGLLNDQRLSKALTDFYPENVLKEVQSFIFGIPSGLHLKYHPNGKESYKVSYKNGKKVGLEVQFSEDGILIAEGEYHEGKPVGKHYRKTPQDQLLYLANFDSEGQLIEPIVEYNSEGQKVLEYFKNDAGYQGQFSEWYPSGALKRNYHYLNDQFDGLQEEFFENGQLKLKCTYIDKKKHGPFEEWFENGQQAFKARYNQGIKTGSFTEYYPDGQTFCLIQFDSSGKLQGEKQIFNQSGRLIMQANFINDLQTGIFQEWHQNGEIKEVSHYIQGKLHGKQEIFYENGKFALKANFNQGLLDGSYTTWFEDGEIHQTKFFALGLPISTHIENYPKNEDGKLQIAKELRYKDGILDGEQLSFYPSGKRQAILTYRSGILHGLKALWDSRGNLVEEATYDMGNLNGRYFSIKPSGNQVIYHYKDNILDGSHEIYFPEHPLFGKIKALEAQYERGLLESELSEYNEAGTKIVSTFYKKGLRDGPVTFYSHDNKLISTTDYKDDLRNGLSTEYFKSGKIQAQVFYIDDQKDGQETIYYDDAKHSIASSRSYKKGKLTGFWQEWDKQGTLVYQAEYENGKKNGMLSKFDEEGNPYVLHRYEDDKLVEKFDCGDSLG